MKELDFITIGQKIKERRTSGKLTQEYVAGMLDVNPSHISNIECGRANPSLTALVNIANILECSVDYFLQDEYTYVESVMSNEEALDKAIISRLRICDCLKKQKILKIMDLL